jgi:hypothetical protein
MPRYEVRITEPAEAATGSDESPIVRDVIWVGETESEGAAVESAWLEWDRKYGVSERPTEIMRPTVILLAGVRVWFTGGPLDSTYVDTDEDARLSLTWTHTEASGGGAGFQPGHVYTLSVKESGEAQYVYDGPTSRAPRD